MGMAKEKTRHQLLVERVASDPALRERAFGAGPEQFLALCRENGLEDMTLEKAEEVQKRLKLAFDLVSGRLCDEQLDGISGGKLGPCASCFC